jgi:hypothetical protein
MKRRLLITGIFVALLVVALVGWTLQGVQSLRRGLALSGATLTSGRREQTPRRPGRPPRGLAPALEQAA